MNIPDLRAFVAVAEAGSVNRAAARLHLTQPAVTRRLQGLEAAMGIALLDRSTRPPALTEDGRQALAYARRVLSAVDDLTSRVGARTGLSGPFRLGVAPGVTEAALGGPLDVLIRQFPGLVPRITTNWSSVLLPALQDDALDAAFVLISDPPPEIRDLDLRPFRHDSVVIIAARPTALPPTPGIADLAAYPWVLNPPGCGFRAALQRAVDRARGDLAICAEVPNYDLQLSLVARGVGLGLVPAARLRASPLRKATKVVTPRDFRLSATQAIAIRAGHDRFLPVIDSLAKAAERPGAGR